MTRKKKLLRIVLLLIVLFLILSLAALLAWLSPHSTQTTDEGVKLEIGENRRQPDVLMPGARFTGLLEIRDHTGEGSLKEGVYPVWGRIDKGDQGSYFELFHEGEDEEDLPILSLWVRLDYDTIRPRIGVHDSWYFDVWLDERDTEAFTMTMENGSLSNTYRYDDGTEQAVIEFHIKQEKKT